MRRRGNVSAGASASRLSAVTRKSTSISPSKRRTTIRSTVLGEVEDDMAVEDVIDGDGDGDESRFPDPDDDNDEENEHDAMEGNSVSLEKSRRTTVKARLSTRSVRSDRLDDAAGGRPSLMPSLQFEPDQDILGDFDGNDEDAEEVAVPARRGRDMEDDDDVSDAGGDDDVAMEEQAMAEEGLDDIDEEGEGAGSDDDEAPAPTKSKKTAKPTARRPPPAASSRTHGTTNTQRVKLQRAQAKRKRLSQFGEP
jgi:hypothetical protein